MSGERMSGQGAGGPGEQAKPAKETAKETAREAAREAAASETVTRRGVRGAAKRFGFVRTPRDLAAQLRATLFHNLLLKLGALLLATVFWFFVSTDDAVVSQRTLRAPLHTEGLSETQQVPGLPERVTVRLSGPASRLRALNPEGLDVVLNLRGVTGTFERGLRVFPPQGITVVRVNPSELIGTVEVRVQKEAPIKVVTLGTPPADTALTVRAEPANVRVEGAETQIAQVTQVLAPYDPATPTPPESAEVKVYAADAQGEPVLGVTVIPAQVSVSAAVSAVLSVRTLPLQLAPVTVPGRRVVAADLTQDEVSVVGPKGILAELSQVTATLPETPALGPGRYTLALTLDLPEGVTARTTPQLELHLR